MRRERPHPLTHRASRLLWGRSRLSHAQRVTHSAASQSRSFGVVRQGSLHPVREKGERSSRHPQNNPRRHAPRFVVGRPSKASWADMLNSSMILFPLWLHYTVAINDPIPPVAPLHCCDGAIRFLKLTSVTAIRPDKRPIVPQPPRLL